MAARAPFVLLDDAREGAGAADAQLFEAPREVFVARRPRGRCSGPRGRGCGAAVRGGTLAGYIAYEAGLALEPRLAAGAERGPARPGRWCGSGCSSWPRRSPLTQCGDWLAERGAGAATSIGPLDPQVSTGAYRDAFEALQEAIRAGDIYQANLTFPLAGSCARRSAGALCRDARPTPEAGYGGVVFDGSHWLLSFSPELFFSLKGGEAKAKPMKGTRPRGRRSRPRTPRWPQELAASVKDQAENLMIVDLMRNDLSRVAEAGTRAGRSAVRGRKLSHGAPDGHDGARTARRGPRARWTWCARCSPADRSPARPRSARWS